eukprot:536477-Rhodomonas_salina.1
MTVTEEIKASPWACKRVGPQLYRASGAGLCGCVASSSQCISQVRGSRSTRDHKCLHTTGSSVRDCCSATAALPPPPISPTSSSCSLLG